MPEVTLGFIFGSYARGQARPDSDVDFAVLLDEQTPTSDRLKFRLHLIDGLARLLGRDDVDVAILNEVPLALAFRVLRDGHLLFERSRAAYVAYRVRTLDQYFDFAPFLERYERSFLRHVSQKGLLYGYNPYRGAAGADQDVAAAPADAAEHDA
jgi:hypothetical protein